LEIIEFYTALLVELYSSISIQDVHGWCPEHGVRVFQPFKYVTCVTILCEPNGKTKPFTAYAIVICPEPDMPFNAPETIS